MKALSLLVLAASAVPALAGFNRCGIVSPGSKLRVPHGGQQYVSDLSEQGNAALDAAQDAAATLSESLEDAVQQRPLAAVGLAIGLGFLIGVTWRR